MSKKKKKKNRNKNREMEKERPEQSSSMIFLKFITSLLFSVLYIAFINVLRKAANKDSYYVRGELSDLIALIFCSIVVISAFFITKDVIKKIFKNKKLTSCLCSIVFTLFILPLCFINVVTVADADSIKRNDIFGKTIEEYSYENIKSVELFVYSGIQYDIKFDSNKTIGLVGEDFVKNFVSDEALISFDKTVSKYCKKTVVPVMGRIQPWNTRRFFRTQEGFEYFDKIFREYY